MKILKILVLFLPTLAFSQQPVSQQFSYEGAKKEIENIAGMLPKRLASPRYLRHLTAL